MAFVSNMPDEQEQQNQAQGPVSIQAGSGTHLAPSAGLGATSAPGAAPASAPKGAGGQFATLQNYVDANQGQAAPLAGKIATGINNQYNTVAGQNQSALQGVQNQVNSGYTPQNQDVLNQEIANPVSFASNPGNVQSFQGQLNDKYTGPSSAESNSAYQTQLANANQAATTAANLNSGEAGLQQTLQQNEAKPNTSVTGLNEAILSKDPSAMGTISNAYQPFSGLTSQLATGAQGIDKSIAGNQAQAQNASAAANKAISDQTSGLQNALNTNLANLTTQAQQYQQGVTANQTAAEKGIQDAINSFEKGVSTDPQGRPIFNAGDFNNIGMGAFAPGATFTTALPTMGQAATADQFALGNALSTLGGTNPLQGVTAGTYNPLATNPSIKDITAPEINPLESFMSNYFAAANPNGAPQGSQFGSGSPTEANVLPWEESFVQPQYQALLNTLNTYLNSSTPNFTVGNSTPGPQLPGGGGFQAGKPIG